MRAQAVNLDFTIALSLFLLTTIASFTALQARTDVGEGTGRSSQIAERLLSETSVQIYNRHLNIVTPARLENYPVDRKVLPPANALSARFEDAAVLNLSTGRFVSVVDIRNQSLSLSYSPTSLLAGSDTSSNDIDTGNSYLSNSKINLSVGPPGITVLKDRDTGRELTRESGNVSIPGTDFSTEERNLSASSLSDSLRIYHNSSEFIIRSSPAIFRLENLSTLYVLNGNRTLSVGPGFSRTFTTEALVLTDASGHPGTAGLLLAGNMSADVKNVTSGVDLNASFDGVLRVRPVDDLSEGFGRALFERGHAKFGPVTSLEAVSVAQRANISSLDNAGVRQTLNIDPSLAYNISFGELRSVGAPTWDGTNNGTAVEGQNLVLNSTKVNANYTEQLTIGSNTQKVSLERATVSVSDIPEDVNLEFQVKTPFRVYRRPLFEGLQVLNFESDLVSSFDVRFVSSRAGGEGNWTVDSYELLYGTAIDKGATLPPGDSVDTETRVTPLVRRNANVSSSVLEVRTWR